MIRSSKFGTRFNNSFEDLVFATFTSERGGSGQKILSHHMQLSKNKLRTHRSDPRLRLLDFTDNTLCQQCMDIAHGVYGAAEMAPVMHQWV